MSTLDCLKALGEEGLADLLRERPVLLDYCSSMSRLVSFVGTGYAVSEALCHTNALEHAAAEVVAALGPVSAEEIATAVGLPAGDAAAVEAVIARLQRLLLVTRLPGGAVAPANGLSQSFPYPLHLGRPIKQVVPQVSVPMLRKAAGLLGLATTGSKAALVDTISRGLRDEGTVRRVLAGAPKGTSELVQRLLTEVVVDVGYGRPPPAPAWLLDRLMLVRLASHGGPAELPQEVALALRGPVLSNVPPAPPPLRSDAVADVDATGAHRSGAVLSLLTSLLEALDAEPAKAIQSGELGVRDLRRLAKAADTDEPTAGMLLEMARAAGLVGTLVTPVDRAAGRANRWQPPPAPLVEWLPTGGYDAWRALGPGARWVAVAGAWLDSASWPSRAGARTATKKTTAAFSHHDDADEASGFRRLVLDLLRSLGPNRAAPVADLAVAVAWHRPRSACWRSADSTGLTGGILAEAELLGLVAGGALSALGRALLDDRDAAEALATAALPAPVQEILLQADLTAIAAGPLDAGVAEELSTMADVEFRGAATIWRFSEGSVRSALDGGASAERMLAFLDERAAKGVPQPLRYLVNDVARRHGTLRVATAATVVTSDDPALLAEVRVARKAAKLQLRELAPTVLASPRPPAVVLDTLRAAGFLPAQEGPDGAVSMGRQERRRATERPQRATANTDVGETARRLLADRADRPSPGGGVFDLDELTLALAGQRRSGGPPGPFGWDEDDGYDDGDEDFLYSEVSTHDLLADAVENGTEVAVFAAKGRRGTEVVGTVTMLTKSTVVLRDTDGRSRPLPLDAIISVGVCP